MGRLTHLAALAAAFGCAACSAHLFSRPNPLPSEQRPVVRIETRNGVEYGAATDRGILFLGRTATEGPCRVHYFLGHQVFVEDGLIAHKGGVIYEAVIDLKHQNVPLLDREIDPGDALLAFEMLGDTVVTRPLRLALDDGVGGDVATYPGVDLAPGTPLFVRSGEEDLLLAGLVAGVATLETGDVARRYVVFSGPSRFREMLLVPSPDPSPRRAKHRPDGITVVR